MQKSKNAKKKQKRKKKSRNAKKAENTFSILKFIQKNRKWKKESTFTWIFSLLYPLCIFFHFKPKNSYKKRQKCKKKHKHFFQIAKINMQKKA